LGNNGMRILAIDVGTGTQDVFLFDSRLDLENGFKLVVPSPTMIVHRLLREATRLKQAVLLTGVTMGGGPSAWAAEDHLRAGLELYATPDAARTFNDDLEIVQAMGVRLVGEDEAGRFPGSVQKLVLGDFDFDAIVKALELFGISLEGLSAVAVAVFDHGNSPPGYSDRQFRFDYLDQRICQENRLSAFAYRAEDIPPIMTRLQAVAKSARQNAGSILIDTPLVVMDTAPAAILGATFDPLVKACRRIMVANLGNFHTLAFRLSPSGIEGVFEHHTGLLDSSRLEGFLLALADGSLKHGEVFSDQGHGALVYETAPLAMDGGDFNLVVTGPKRNLLRPSTLRLSSLRPYFATPFGDMMMTGCYGLLAATGELLPELAEPIRSSMSNTPGAGVSPWDIP
jgi:uncharacterized protein (DUF1786 family)